MMKKVFMDLVKGAAAVAGVLVLIMFMLSLDNYYERERMMMQSEIDATMYVGRMNAYMMVCTGLEISPQACIGAWASGGNN